MGTLRVKKSFLREVKIDDVIEELKAKNYFEKAHREMLAYVKETVAYKQMREIANQQMFNTLTNSTGYPDAEAQKIKKKKIKCGMHSTETSKPEDQIGKLALDISSSISNTISEKLSKEARNAAKRALKNLSDKKSGWSNSLSNSRRKRKQDASSTEILQEQNKRMKLEDHESDVSLDGISSTVSSVHTSDLSSFDDEIVVSSEDEKGEKKEKRISFKTANKAYFGDGFSQLHDVIARNKIPGKITKKPKMEKKSSAKTSNESIETFSLSRPRRERKPNSKYSAEDNDI